MCFRFLQLLATATIPMSMLPSVSCGWSSTRKACKCGQCCPIAVNAWLEQVGLVRRISRRLGATAHKLISSVSLHAEIETFSRAGSCKPSLMDSTQEADEETLSYLSTSAELPRMVLIGAPHSDCASLPCSGMIASEVSLHPAAAIICRTILLSLLFLDIVTVWMCLALLLMYVLSVATFSIVKGGARKN